MGMKHWLDKNGSSLRGKTAVITGGTGGLGSAACRYLLTQGCSVLMVNRSEQKSQALCDRLRREFPGADIRWLPADLSRIEDVRTVCDQLRTVPLDILILNAGTYAVPREKCSSGYDVVFQTNFLSHYCMVRELLPVLSARRGKIVAVGSIAHNFVKTDFEDPDFFTHKGDNDIYGNSKRWLMFSLTELLRKHPEVGFAIGHPGISFTGITSNYPKYILPFVKVSMKILFMWPNRAVRSIVKGVFAEVPELHWIGPRFFDIWGNPVIKPLDTCPEEERQEIFRRAEQMYAQLMH